MKVQNRAKEKAITTKDTKDHEENTSDARNLLRRAQGSALDSRPEAGATALPEYFD